MNPLALVLVVVLILLLVGLIPGGPVTHNLGYWPSGTLGVVLILLIIVLLLR